MSRIAELIALLKNKRLSDEACLAVLELVRLGHDALPQLIEAHENADADFSRNVCFTISEVRDAASIPFLVGLLSHPSVELRLSAYRAFSKIKHDRSLRHLVSCLLSQEQHTLIEEKILVQALGELGNKAAIPHLRVLLSAILAVPPNLNPLTLETFVDQVKITHEYWEEVLEEKLTILIDIVVALSKLGDDELNWMLIELSEYRLPEESEYFDLSVIREHALQSLQCVVAPHMVPLLKRNLVSEVLAEPLHVADALFYVGTKEAIIAFFDLLPHHISNPDLHEQLVVRISKLTGIPYSHPTEMKRQWAEKSGAFEERVSYRWGQPLNPSHLINRVWDAYRTKLCYGEEHFYWELYLLWKEMHIISGEDFGYIGFLPMKYQLCILDHIRTWWNTCGSRFESGKIYKYGIERNLAR